MIGEAPPLRFPAVARNFIVNAGQLIAIMFSSNPQCEELMANRKWEGFVVWLHDRKRQHYQHPELRKGGD